MSFGFGGIFKVLVFQEIANKIGRQTEANSIVLELGVNREEEADIGYT